MSYLNLSKGIPDFSKAVISLWFRVPKETLAATAAAWKGDFQGQPAPPFDGITPLIVFGDDTIKGYETLSGITPTEHYIQEHWSDLFVDPDGTYRLRDGPFDQNNNVHTFTLGIAKPHDPCYIGIDCNRSAIESGSPSSKPNVLRINIQMSTLGSGSGMVPVKTSSSVSGDHIIYSPGGVDNTSEMRGDGNLTFFGPDRYGNGCNMIPDYNPWGFTNGYTDHTDIQIKSQTERFKVKLDNLEITPDQWHHVLVSFDLSGPIRAEGVQSSSRYSEENVNDPDHGSASTACKAWVAVDDIDYKGADLRDRDDFDDYVTSRLTFGPHDIITQNAIDTALTRIAANGTTGPLAQAGWVSLNTDSGFSKPIYNYTPGNIKSKGFSMGFPATAKYVKNILRVEMAEFQMWTGMTLDTGNAANRRAFIDQKRDASGRVIPEKDKSTPLKPVSPKKAEKLLNKKPNVLLHINTKWIHGENTGTLGVTIGAGGKTKKNPDGQFQPTAKIEKYKPEPALGIKK